MSQEDHITGEKQSKFSILNFYEENNKAINIGAAVFIVLVLGIWAYFKFYVPKQEAKANAELYMAERYFAMDSIDLALNGDGVHLGVLDLAGSGTKAGKKASYMAGRALMEKGQYEEAISYLKDADFDDMLVGPLAKCLIGDCYSEMEDYANAAKFYMKGSSLNPNQFTTPYALKKAARAYEKTGEWKSALKAYTKIKTDYKDTEAASQIDKYIARAEARIGS